MRKMKDHKTGELTVRLDPGEKQYLASLNLRNIAPEVWAEVKRKGAARWLKRRLQLGIDQVSKDDSTKGR